MSSKNQVCLVCGKTIFDDKLAAERSLVERKRKGNREELSPYKCSEGHWHLGHPRGAGSRSHSDKRKKR